MDGELITFTGEANAGQNADNAYAIKKVCWKDPAIILCVCVSMTQELAAAFVT